ncbi:MAG TPA: tetratricopeptide repeat protein, partial [Desulfobacterales bacterium]|nr:tetratricopeptide repeat protein [Desulfobacterales bacterium]
MDPRRSCAIVMSRERERHPRRWPVRFHLLATLIVLLAVGEGAAGLAAPPAADPLARAATALEQGRVRRAVAHLLAAAGRWPESPEVQRNLALAYYDLRLLDESVAAMRRAVALAPDEALYRMELGALFLAADRHDLALEQLFAALERNPGLGEAYWYLGRLYLETGQLALARRALTRAERLGVESGWLRDRLPVAAAAEAPLTAAAAKPAATPEKIALRLLPVAGQQAGERLLAAITAGEVLFEFAGDRPEVAAPVRNGGYVGMLAPAELDPALCRAICEQPPFAPPQLVTTGERVLVVQRLAPFDPKLWRPKQTTAPVLAAPRASSPGLQAAGEAKGLLRS